MPALLRSAIEAHHHEDVAGPDLAHQLGHQRPSPRRTGGVLLVDDLTAGRPELVDLHIDHLFLGLDAGIADQAAGRAGRGGIGAGHEGSRCDCDPFV